jgi:hypothetical protein
MKSASRFVAIQVSVLALISCGGQTASSPSPSPTVDPARLAALEARPLTLPVVPPGAACPGHNTNVIDLGNGSISVNGDGPIYFTGKGLQVTSAWGEYYDPTYYAPPQLTGLVLLRLRDLKTGRAGVFVGPYAAGDVVGTDTIDGKAVQQHAEVVLDASHHPATSSRSKWGIWDVRQGWPTGWSGCFGFQLDGAGFTEDFTY